MALIDILMTAVVILATQLVKNTLGRIFPKLNLYCTWLPLVDFLVSGLSVARVGDALHGVCADNEVRYLGRYPQSPFGQTVRFGSPPRDSLGDRFYFSTIRPSSTGALFGRS